MGGEGEGVQRATTDFVCFHCPLEPAEKTNFISEINPENQIFGSRSVFPTFCCPAAPAGA